MCFAPKNLQEKAFLANAYSMMGQCQGMVGKMKARLKTNREGTMGVTCRVLRDMTNIHTNHQGISRVLENLTNIISQH